jgi:hypothetical protein
MSEPINVDTPEKLLEIFGSASFMPKTLLDTDPLVRFDTERSMDPAILAQFLHNSTKRPKMRDLDDDWFS